MAYGAIINDLRSVGTGLAANMKPDIDSVLRVLEPYQTPFMQFLFFSNKKSQPVYAKTAKFSWFEDELFPHQALVATTVTASTTLTLSVSSVPLQAIFKLNDLVFIESGSQMGYVSSVTAGGGGDVVITHIDGSTALADATAGAYLRIIGSVNSENNSTPVAKSTQEVEVFNYLTIFTESVKNTGRDQAGQTYTNGTTHADQVSKKMKEMKFQAERNFIYSISAGVKSSSNIQTTWGKGLFGFLTTNVVEYIGDPDEAQWDDYLAQVFDKGSNSRIHYAGSNQFMRLQKIVKDKVGNLDAVTNAPITGYGVRLTRYFHAKGDVNIVWNPVLEGAQSDWGLTIDPGSCGARHMNNDDKGSRKFRVEPNVQTPGTDRKETKLLMDIGFQYQNQETGGIFKLQP